ARRNVETPPLPDAGPHATAKVPAAAHAHAPEGTTLAIGHDVPGHRARWRGYVPHPRADSQTTRPAPAHSDRASVASGGRHNCALRSTDSRCSGSPHPTLHWSACAHTYSRTTVRLGPCAIRHSPPTSW